MIMASEECDGPLSDAQERIAELEHRLHDSESARSKDESTIPKQHDDHQKLKAAHSSAMDHFGQRLKEADKKLEQAKDERMGLELEIRYLKHKIAHPEEPSTASGACTRDGDVATSVSANAVGDSHFSPDEEPQRKRVKVQHTPYKPSNMPPKRNVPCTKCYAHGWKCDDGEACENCVLRSQYTKCRRMECKFFKAGTCPLKDQCVYAHDDDGYKHLIVHARLSRRKVGEFEPEPAVQQHEWEMFLRQGGKLDGEDDLGGKVEGHDDEEFGDLMRGLGKY